MTGRSHPDAAPPARPGATGEGGLRIAIVAHFAYRALAGGATGHIGGVENQTSMMARWLAARGHTVTLIVWDEGQQDGIVVEGVHVLKVCRQDAGARVLRFFHPRWTSLVAALARADADVYYQNCGEYVTGQVALWCRRHRRAFVYSAASDADCNAELPLMPERRVRALYRTGVRLADAIVVQTPAQQRMMRDGFARDATVIPMPCATPRSTGVVARDPALVLWVGRICRVKRPDRLLEIARACPELQFLIVGPHDEDASYKEEIEAAAAGVPNVRLHGPANRAELDDLYQRALCLCCTSDHEGFPNTFLEAWSHGLPVVSSWDPASIIADNGLGLIGRTADELAASLAALRNEAGRWDTLSAAARAYFDENHAIERAMPRFERIFSQQISARRPLIDRPITAGVAR
jgi:glycosyltransferase involved in cell wall biosynthesis